MAKLNLGKPRVAHDLPSHVPGINQGNAKGKYDDMSGHKPDGTSSAARSTGINPEARDPIDPSMPNLSPA